MVYFFFLFEFPVDYNDKLTGVFSQALVHICDCGSVSFLSSAFNLRYLLDSLHV